MWYPERNKVFKTVWKTFLFFHDSIKKLECFFAHKHDVVCLARIALQRKREWDTQPLAIQDQIAVHGRRAVAVQRVAMNEERSAFQAFHEVLRCVLLSLGILVWTMILRGIERDGGKSVWKIRSETQGAVSAAAVGVQEDVARVHRPASTCIVNG